MHLDLEYEYEHLVFRIWQFMCFRKSFTNYIKLNDCTIKKNIFLRNFLKIGSSRTIYIFFIPVA